MKPLAPILTPQFNIGATWDLDQIEGIKALNEDPSSKGKVTSVYGSLSGFNTARSQDRIPDIPMSDAHKYIDAAREIGVGTRWTMNQSCVGTLEDLKSTIRLTNDLIGWLKGIDCHEYVVTIPLIAEIILDKDPDAKIEVSTINHITSMQEIDQWAKLGVKGICWDVFQNRNLTFLYRALRHIEKSDFYIELITNELCTFMCHHRSICYNLSSHSSTRDLYGGYPFSRCIAARSGEPWRWVSTRFILPSCIPMYQHLGLFLGRAEDLGINRFKITGRTHTTDTILRILTYYMFQQDPPNLLDLWPHINKLVDDQHNPSTDVNIPTTRLNLHGRMHRLLRVGAYCTHHICGVTCKECITTYNAIQNELTFMKKEEQA